MTEWTGRELIEAGRKMVSDSAWPERELRSFLAALGAVHPVDARERERRAWDAAMSFVEPSIAPNVPRSMLKEQRNRSYPSLTPPEPPPLVLSTGSWTLVRGRGWRGAAEGSALLGTPIICNVSDARALADWLAKYGTEKERR